ncbi:MAG: 2TM domain-containing protein [Tannerella sp.]|nr:2TM domain-containing protein [Tannerella sp.]
MEQIHDNEARQRAERRANELRGFYSHLLTYCIVNAGLFLIDCLTSPGRWWFFWPLLGWGIGLLCHGLGISRCGLWGEAWKERKIAELMEKEKRAE